MNTLRYWELRDDACILAQLRPVQIHHVFTIPTALRNFMSALGIRILIANSCTRCRKIFEVLSQDELQTKLAENLRASPFNKELSNETSFSMIHLAGEYL